MYSEANTGFESTWTPPTFDFSKAPRLMETLSVNSDVEDWTNFARKSVWCPDGQSILSQCENRSFQINTLGAQGALRSFTQAAPILDFAWYPAASSSTPATYCYAGSVRECPVKLLDANDGRLRASYSIVDHRERQVAPHSLAFSPSGEKLFCGFDSAFEIFDVGSPGSVGTRVMTTPAKKSRDGIKGIVSTLVHAPTSNSLAAGSLTPSPWNIAIYDLDTEPVRPAMYMGLGEQSLAGVTQIIFNPMSPHLLYASFRRRHGVYAWDLRYLDEGPFVHYTTENKAGGLTSQRRHFSVDVTGRWLSSGDQNGKIHSWDLSGASEGTKVCLPVLAFDAHKDSVPSVAYHPFKAQLVSTSGGRHFFDDDDSGSSGSDSDSDSGLCLTVTRRYKPHPSARDVSMKIWHLGGE